MVLQEIPFPLRLCVEMLHYSAFMSPQAANKTGAEVVKELEAFFAPELIAEARAILTGNSAIELRAR